MPKRGPVDIGHGHGHQDDRAPPAAAGAAGQRGRWLVGSRIGAGTRDAGHGLGSGGSGAAGRPARRLPAAFWPARVGAFYAAALLLWSGAIWQIRPQGLAVLALLPVALQLMWQVGTLKENGLDPLVKFRSNRFAGLLMFLGCLVVGSA